MCVLFRVIHILSPSSSEPAVSETAQGAALTAGHQEVAVLSFLPRPERAGPCWASPGLPSLWPQQARSGGCRLNARVRGRRALSAGAGGYLYG